MKISVIVPTYCRPNDLERCLTALEKQNRVADEVIVIVRDTDTATRTFLDATLAEAKTLQLITITVAGVIAAMNAGLEKASGDVICFTDDDAAPHPSWLEQIETHFKANPHLGGVGGRDLIQRNDPNLLQTRAVVGRLQWFGRTIGNHHLGAGTAREVDILKGVNMSYRRLAIGDLRFDHRMLGSGAQVHFELAFSLAIKRRGWKLIYDPNLLVDHYVAQRFDEDQRSQFNGLAYTNAVHNETVALLDHFSWLQRFIFSLWSILIGTRQALGLLQWIRLFPKLRTLATQQFVASWQGRKLGWATWRNSKLLSTQHLRST
ncbi:MAG: glycosyltransferase family 2 protein [Leptolyngbya sp. SIO3F4]|nr:glycosyltransferase family 2 protein [Leptolyngbya sp. SIO3F4]